MDGSMLAALEAAHRDRWTRNEELLRTIALRVDLLWRQTVVLAGGEEPDALSLPRPGESPPPKPSLRDTALRALAHLR